MCTKVWEQGCWGVHRGLAYRMSGGPVGEGKASVLPISRPHTPQYWFLRKGSTGQAKKKKGTELETQQIYT